MYIDVEPFYDLLYVESVDCQYLSCVVKFRTSN